jgi:hypothetical protein
MNAVQHKRISKLITALRSGQYQPNYDSRLKDKQGNYDILGLACQLSKLGCWKERKDFGLCYVIVTKTEDNYPIEDFQDAVMPKKVIEYYGFKDAKGGFGGDEEDNNFITYNDLARDEEEGEEGKGNGHGYRNSQKIFEEDIKDTKGRIRKYPGYQHDTAKCLKVPKFTSAPSLAQLHDTQQMDFKQLAKFIERAMKDEKVGLFKVGNKK